MLIPFLFSFELDFSRDKNAYYLLYIMPTVLFFIDILIQFNTGYYDEGVIMLDRTRIF